MVLWIKDGDSCGGTVPVYWFGGTGMSGRDIGYTGCREARINATTCPPNRQARVLYSQRSTLE